MGLNPDQDLRLFLLVLCSFIDRGEFGEVYQGTAIDILGNDTGPTPVAVKVRERLVFVQYMCVCISCTAESVYSFFLHIHCQVLCGTLCTIVHSLKSY